MTGKKSLPSALKAESLRKERLFRFPSHTPLLRHGGRCDFYGTIDKVFIRLDGTGQEVLAYQYFDDVHRWQINDHVGIWWYEKDEVRVER